MRRIMTVKKHVLITFIIIFLFLTSILILVSLPTHQNEAFSETQTTDLLEKSIVLPMITPITIPELDYNTSIEQDLKEVEITLTETNDYVYATDYVHYRKGPNTDSEIWGTAYVGQEIYRLGICDNGWSKVFITNLECYICSDYLTTEKPIIQEVQEIQPVYSTYSPSDLMNLGVIYDGGYKYTWYSELVLPGGGLGIPGRYSDGNFVRDENGYICVASSDFDKGTILETPWGTAKVYDCGCASGTIDIYVSW